MPLIPAPLHAVFLSDDPDPEQSEGEREESNDLRSLLRTRRSDTFRPGDHSLRTEKQLGSFIVLTMHFRKRAFSACAILLGCALLLLPLACWGSDGKPNERIYNAPFEKVWQICIQTANQNWKVTHTDQSQGILKFRQGMSLKTNSWGMHVRVTVSRVDESHTKVILNSEKIDPLELSWAGRDIRKRFFAVLDNSFVTRSTKTDDPTNTGPTASGVAP